MMAGEHKKQVRSCRSRPNGKWVGERRRLWCVSHAARHCAADVGRGTTPRSSTARRFLFVCFFLRGASLRRAGAVERKWLVLVNRLNKSERRLEIKQAKPAISERERGLLQRTSSLSIHVGQLQRRHRILMHENEQLVRGTRTFRRVRDGRAITSSKRLINSFS